MQNYLQQHLSTVYLPSEFRLPGLRRFQNQYGWQDHYIGDKLLFSHRKTKYDLAGFPEKLHTHRFYELDIYVEGNINYIAENREFAPQRDNIILVPPGCQHTARLLDSGIYERYVIYFDPSVLDFLERGYFGSIFQHREAACLSVIPEKRAEFYYLRERLMDIFYRAEPDTAAQAMCCAVQLLLLIFNFSRPSRHAIAEIPEKVLAIKHFTDHNFRELNTTEEIAGHFFYSREYVSRIFKQHYNTNLSEYLVSRKIDHAKQLLKQGNSVAFSCMEAGFRSPSAFINAFRAQTGMTPSEYRRACRSQTL